MSEAVCKSILGARLQDCADDLREAGHTPEDLEFILEYCGLQDDIGYLGIIIQRLNLEPVLGRVPTDAQKKEVACLWDTLPDDARKIIGEPRFMFYLRYG
jgi:hypothetical protein